MSPRIKRLRKILNPPSIKGFMPYGNNSSTVDTSPVLLHYEEYESLRLCDYEGLTHFDASGTMGISRPTFTRIYAMARHKVAVALAEGRQLSIEGGKVYFDSDWYECKHCRCYFNNPDKDKTVEKCPLCGNSSVQNFNENSIVADSDSTCSDDSIICTECGKHIKVDTNTQNGFVICPECNNRHRHCGRK